MTQSSESEHPQSPFKMTISLNVLKHLGIGLYSNIPAVLAEMVANAWDAEATRVSITVDPANGTVEIQDDGVGMDLNDINNRFLRVGYEKRIEFGDSTPSLRRKVMGRKGIGKLSCFSIATEVDVLTAKNGQKNALRMSRNAIMSAVKEENPTTGADYRPEDIGATATIDFDHGTRLVLRNFDRRLDWTEGYLRKRIARRFTVIGPAHSFLVEVNRRKVSATDRDFYDQLQFLWFCGPEGKAAKEQSSKLEFSEAQNWTAPREDGDIPGEPYVLRGWVGTVVKPESIDEDNNSITVFAKGKVVQEDVLKDIREARIFGEYLIGEVHAEFLDDDRDDIVTSDRQRLKETDPRYAALKRFVAGLVKEVGNRWDELRVEASEKVARTLPVVDEWYRRLHPAQLGAAKKMFGRIESLKLPDEKARQELYRASILAFERLEHRELLESVRAVGDPKKDSLLAELFERIDAIEGAQHQQIMAGRLALLEKIRELGSGAPVWRDETVRKYVVTHPWLFDPAWDGAQDNTKVQQKLAGRRDKNAGRLHCLSTADADLLLVLVSSEVGADRANMENLAAAAIGDLRAVTATGPDPEEPRAVHVHLLLPSPPAGSRRAGGVLNAKEPHATVQYVTYGEMLARASKAYGSLLEKGGRSSEIAEMMARVEEALSQPAGHPGKS